MPEVTINLSEEDAAVIDGVRGHFSRAQFAAGLIFYGIEMWVDEKQAEQHRLSKEFFGKVARTRSRVAELAEAVRALQPSSGEASGDGPSASNRAPAGRSRQGASTGPGKPNGNGSHERDT
jgi:hypothetical protein